MYICFSLRDMKDAYSDLKDAGLDATGNDKYFHAKANYEAANRGPGGKHASAIIRYMYLCWLSFRQFNFCLSSNTIYVYALAGDLAGTSRIPRMKIVCCFCQLELGLF